MNIEIQERGWTILTKSNCNYCTKAKALLPNAHIVSCDEHIKKYRTDFLCKVDALSGCRPRTFPMIFRDKAFIGGYDETKAYLDELNSFSLDASF